MTELEQAFNSGAIPWKSIEYRAKDYWIFADDYPVTEGHLLFVPTEQKWENLNACFKAAYSIGYDGIESARWDGFNIGQNCGEAAGQTVIYPHVHMIPRRKGDSKNPRGGVRHVIPEKGFY